MYEFIKALVSNASDSRVEWVARRSMELLAESRRQDKEFEEEVAEWWRAGDGRRRGYAFPVCRHGSSLWVDHDVACWMCEAEGSYWIYLQELRKAKDAAEVEFERWFAVAQSLLTLSSVKLPRSAKGTSDVEEAREALKKWVLDNWFGYVVTG